MRIELRLSEQELKTAKKICQRDGTDLDSFLTLVVRKLISQSADIKDLNISSMSPQQFIDAIDLGIQQALAGDVVSAEDFFEQLFAEFEG